MKSIGEFFLLFFLYFKVLLFHVLEERKVRKAFYVSPSFRFVDRALKKLYRFKNPYKICRQFEKTAVYGETPLTVFHQMFQKGDLKPSDCFVDLGSGRGRGIFFASTFWKSKAIGVDAVPFFHNQAQTLIKKSLSTCQFFCQDLFSFELQQGSFFYFYSICMKEEELIRFIVLLEKIKKGSKVVTVSFPLSDYSNLFQLSSSWEVSFPWGKADLFLHVKH